MNVIPQQTASAVEALPTPASAAAPDRCALCGTTGSVAAAGFQQILPQAGAAPARLSWWECRRCRAWFVDPVPNPETIARYWKTVLYADQGASDLVADLKNRLIERTLEHLGRRVAPGELLDVGCNFGRFLDRARAAGWQGRGFEPNPQAAEVTRKLGFEVATGWELAEAGFRPGQFQAIVVIDVFYYSWHPFADLKTFCRLLRPGGMLAMRLSNKRQVLGAVRALTPPGPKRDRRLTALLQAQFHSIAARSLQRILLDNGFSEVEIWPGATTARFSEMTWKGKLAYPLAGALYRLSFGRINVSPGILLFARKAA